MNIKNDYLKPGHRLRPGGSYKKTSITIHSTGNPGSTIENERAWLDNPANTRLAAWHYVVGENEVICAIPDGEEAWHSGTTEGNKYSIGIELIETGNRKAVADTGAYLVAELLKKHGLSLGDIRKHYDWTKKNCPRILIDKSYIKDGINWSYFLDRVRYYLEGEIVEKRYNTLEECPGWARDAVKLLLDKGYLTGNEKGVLNLSEDMLRVLVVNYRAGAYK